MSNKIEMKFWILDCIKKHLLNSVSKKPCLLFHHLTCLYFSISFFQFLSRSFSFVRDYSTHTQSKTWKKTIQLCTSVFHLGQENMSWTELSWVELCWGRREWSDWFYFIILDWSPKILRWEVTSTRKSTRQE